MLQKFETEELFYIVVLHDRVVVDRLNNLTQSPVSHYQNLDLIDIILLQHYLSSRMALSKHIDPETIIEKLRGSDEKAHSHHVHQKNAISQLTPYSSRYNATDEIAKFKIPQNGAPVGWPNK